MKWPLVELEGACSKIGSGATPRGGSKSYKLSGISLVRSMNVHLGRFKPDNLAFIDEAQGAKLSNVALEPDDVLLNITGASVARACMLDNTVLPARVNQHVCILRPEPSKLDGGYLMQFLISELVQQRLLRIANAGATREAITKTELQKFEIPLPPLAEQKRIAGILNAADALRAKRKQALAHLDELLQSTFLTLFGDPVTNPMGWEKLGFSAAIEDKTKAATKILKSEYSDSGKWQIIDQSQKEIAGYSDLDSAYEDSLPVVIFGDHTRCIKLVRTPFLLGADGAKVLAPREPLNGVFLASLLPLLDIQDLGYSRHMKEIKRQLYIVPPLPLQQRFAAIVEKIEAQKARHRAHLAELDTLFASLQSRAFAGEL
ncbi:restriction endonuclease subunit S [Roseibacillus persicicus]|uniref:restriction endonuclease subunit S n=1 Tax=Roseibacillus persicicus TaxID=454148 RepID=UPI00280D7A71|nr:restriction endonuclease subunit S [Roseibacillus persicicus]MDQ8191291.1 restriction endonuclease subunit S [Roseibacillus persicicus]